MSAYALLSEYVTRDEGYCNQRIDLAGRLEDKATLAKYPLLVEADTPTPACRALLYFDRDAPDPWSPVLRTRFLDDLSIFLTPIGVLIELFPLDACAPFLPLLVRGPRRSRRVILDREAGAVTFDGEGNVTAATLQPGTEEQADVGLVALRLARVRSLPADCPFVALASADAVSEHLEDGDLATEGALPERVRLRPFTRRLQPQFRVPPASERRQQPEGEHRARQGISAQPAAPYCLESQHTTSPARTVLPPRVWPLWDYLVRHRLGFDLLRDRAAVMGDALVTLDETSAELSLRWARRDDDTWHVGILRYINRFDDDEPLLAQQDEREDREAITRVIQLAAETLSLTVTMN
jgi:hypothetical protein